MNNYIILTKKRNQKKVRSIIKSLTLKKTLGTSRTTIWENDDLQISIDKSLIRVLVYSNSDIEEYRRIFKNEV